MSAWDDEAGYALDDPKHPSFADRMFEAADLARKKEREDDLAAGEELQAEKSGWNE